MGSTLIKFVRIFDGLRILEQQNVTIRGGLTFLNDYGNASEIINGSGMTLFPGLWDTHVHLSETQPFPTEQDAPQLDMTKHGITTAIECGRMSKSEHELNNVTEGFPEVYYAGNFATSTGSLHSTFPSVDEDNIVDTIEDATRFVQRRVAEGADYVKIVADNPGPSQEVIDQLSREAQLHGKLTIVHAARKKAFEMALSANPPVNFITHVPLDVPISREDADKMAELQITAIPTLVMEEALAKSGMIPGARLEAALESVQHMIAAGVHVLVGTDSNGSLIGPRHGEAILREMELLQQVGMKPLDVLRAATQLSAQCFKKDDSRGTIAAGMRADVVLVEGDPTKDLGCLTKVKKVWKAGKVIYSVKEDDDVDASDFSI
ncbi:hydrolase [Aaosphaeria arxii CBS 175.79]|uniref:Hydrolase n=1 Tax=Aaosphaeria arxii CBS 175.79 TaxID=1450172 RepID=A0A6A5Y7E0_9PLEO|nr:hydrolase [Aaosphaeria arxii CBS 175.79]KAF2020474.1 hydrolase [Aaosphaeria arxii CBS 175.79]